MGDDSSNPHALARRTTNDIGDPQDPCPHQLRTYEDGRAALHGCARQAQIVRAQGESEAIQTVFAAINAGKATPELLSYKYLEMLPKIADGQASKLWMVPSDLTGALESISKGFNLGK